MASAKYNSSDLTYQRYDPRTEYPQVELIWRSLLRRVPHSFFLSWGWISAWLTTLPQQIALSLVVGSARGEVVIAFFVGEHHLVRHKFIFSTVLGLNTTANPYFDQIYIEHNAVLGDGIGLSELCSLLDKAALASWDEFMLPGVLLTPAELDDMMSQDQFTVVIDKAVESHFVDLTKIRENNMDYYHFLSPNRRQQIRRSIKQYEKNGAIQLRLADNVDAALEMLNSLKALHQREWIKRGEKGAFESEYFQQFHQALIRECFDRGEIQLICVYTEEMVIGYIYNFVYNQNVLFYQCGLNYRPENAYRPGIVSHYYAILHNAQQGYLTYDFLAGDVQYKRSLSMGAQKMYWLRLQQKRRRFWLENQLKMIKSRLRK